MQSMGVYNWIISKLHGSSDHVGIYLKHISETINEENIFVQIREVFLYSMVLALFST